MIDTGLFGLV